MLQGTAWNVGHCAAGLIASGAVPPFVVVAVDSAGPSHLGVWGFSVSV